MTESEECPTRSIPPSSRDDVRSSDEAIKQDDPDPPELCPPPIPAKPTELSAPPPIPPKPPVPEHLAPELPEPPVSSRGRRNSQRGGRGGRDIRNNKDKKDHMQRRSSSSDCTGKRGGSTGGTRSQPQESFHEQYISQEEYEDGVADGTVIVGTLRVVIYPFRSYVVREGEARIVIESRKNLNRACHGDVVAVKLIPRIEDPKKKKDKTDKSAPANETETEEEEEEVDLPLSIEEEDKDEGSQHEKEEGSEKEEPLYGKVVYIVEAQHPEVLLGVIDASDNRFHPLDARIPFMDYHRSRSIQLPDGPDLQTTLLRARILPWPASRYNPMCEIIEEAGDVNDFDIQYKLLKEQHNIDYTDHFDGALTADLPLSGWTIPEDELARRADLRQDLIFTIDPATAKDLDDALSCERLPNGNYKVGVHIADVSYFVQTDSPLDLEARRRASTVYFAQENVPMLPRILCDELCSIKARQDRLTFSVIWELTKTGEKVSETFTRSVINTRAQLDYNTAQKMIKEPHLFKEDEERADVARAVRMLNRLARKISTKRFANGSVALDSAEFSFQFDKNGEVVGVVPYERFDSHFLVEEFMLLANVSVADFLVNNLSQGVMLRRHPPVDAKKLKTLERQCKFLKIDIDTSSSLALHQSIQRLREQYDGITTQAILFLLSRTMQSARYCATELESEPEQYHHYALNYPRYSHFTSPIRRYPDLVTHRQLAAVLEGHEQPMSPELVSEISVDCNKRTQDANYASRDCHTLYLSRYLRTRPVIAKGIVVGLSKRGVSILVPSYDVNKDIRFDLDEYDVQWKQAEKEVVITWPSTKEASEKQAVKTPACLKLRLLSTVDVQLLHATSKSRHIVDVRLLHPDDASSRSFVSQLFASIPWHTYAIILALVLFPFLIMREEQ